MAQLETRGHNNPLSCCHMCKWHEVRGTVFWNTKPHTTVSGILLTMSRWRSPTVCDARELGNGEKWHRHNGVSLPLCLVVMTLGSAQSIPGSSYYFNKMLAHPKSSWEQPTKLKVCVYALLFLVFMMFVWGSAQLLKLCFSNDAIYEQSGMNIPEGLTESGILPPLTELASVDFHIQEPVEMSFRPVSSCSCSVINGLIVKRVTWKTMSVMHFPQCMWQL